VGEAAGFLEETVIYADLELAIGLGTLYTRWGEWVQIGTLVATGLYLAGKRPFSKREFVS
jgi:hypothetical protein